MAEPAAGAAVAVVFFDARIKIRDEGAVKNKAVYLALGVLPDGTEDHPRDLDRTERGSEVLTAGNDRN